MDTACVELRFLDGTMLAIDTIAVEKFAANMYERSELGWMGRRKQPGLKAASAGVFCFEMRLVLLF